MKDANQKILDVLILIADVLGADIPAGLRGLVPAAEDAAAGMNDAFSKIEDPTVTVRTVWEGPGDNPDLRGAGARAWRHRDPTDAGPRRRERPGSRRAAHRLRAGREQHRHHRRVSRRRPDRALDGEEAPRVLRGMGV